MVFLVPDKPTVKVPDFSSVDGYKDCLKKIGDKKKEYCMPIEQPDECRDDAWEKLQPMVPKKCTKPNKGKLIIWMVYKSVLFWLYNSKCIWSKWPETIVVHCKKVTVVSKGK